MNAFLKSLGDNRIYPLTDRRISGLSHTDQIVELGNRGVRVIQLREKELSGREFFEQAASAVRVAHERAIKVIINDRVDIALAVDADGVHLGQDDMPAEAARRILGPDAIIGVSSHTLAQAKVAASAPIDYVAVGPIFSTPTKISDNIPLGFDGLRDVRSATPGVPLVAIGGVTRGDAAVLLEAGADALAMIRDLWKPEVSDNESGARKL
jgi:thiamine-phosphate pyrophosphorylase